MKTTRAELMSKIAKTGFQVIEESAHAVTLGRDDSRPFELAILQRVAERLGVGYTFTGERVISRRRIGRAVFEQRDPATYTGIRFEF